MPIITISTQDETINVTASTLVIQSGTLTDAQATKVSNLPDDTNASLLLKVDKVTGKALSTNDYDNTEKAKVTANTLKTGITTDQANAIIANTAKAGITPTQAANIVTNNAKPTTDAVNTLLSSKADLVDGVIPTNQIPGAVDEVLEYANFAAFPVGGADAKIYVAIDTGLTYRWSGTQYTQISPTIALGETSATAYRGDRGADAYTHSQLTHDKTLVGLSNVENKSSADIRGEIVEADIPAEIARVSSVPTLLSDLTEETTHRTVSDTEKATWNAKAETSAIPTTTTSLTDTAAKRFVSDTQINAFASGSSAVPIDYTSVANLIAGQANQFTDRLYRINDGARDFKVQYLGTTLGTHADYAGWPAITLSDKNNNFTFKRNAGRYNKLIKSIEVYCDAALASQLTVTPQIDGSNVLNSSIVIAAGSRFGVSTDFAISTLNAWEDITAVIGDTGTVIEIVVETIEISDAISVPVPQLSTPTMGTVTVDGATSLTFNWNDPNSSPDEASVDFIYDTASDFSVSPTTVNKTAGSTSHQLTGLTEGVTIYAKVIAKGDGVTASDSEESGVVWETPIGVSYVINDNFITPAWADTTVPDGYTKFANDASNYVEQTANGMRIVGTGISFGVQKAAIFTIGTSYDFELEITEAVSGTCGIENAAFGWAGGSSFSTTGVKTFTWVADREFLYIKRGGVPLDMSIGYIQVTETP